MNLINVMLGKRRQEEKSAYCVISYIKLKSRKNLVLKVKKIIPLGKCIMTGRSTMFVLGILMTGRGHEGASEMLEMFDFSI